MATNIRLAAFGVAALGAAMTLVTSASAAVGLVDNFDGADLSAYQFTKVLDNNTATQTAFSLSGGTLRSSYSATGTAAAEQALLLRDDRPLAVGERLVVDISGLSPASATFDRDLGIAVGFSKTPAGLGAGAGGDARTSYVEVSLRGNNSVVSFARNGAANLTSGQEFTGTPYGGQTFNSTDPLSLYITHVTTNTFEVGWVQNGVRHALTNNGAGINPYTITDANVPGAAVGMYTDLRAALALTPAGLDNLRIEAVPEPTTLAALAGVGLVGLRRRRR